MNFSDITLSHFENPKNVGRIKNGNNVVHTLVGSPDSHFLVSFDVQLQDDVIVDAKFKAYGCVSTIAGASFITESIKGKTVAEANALVDISFLMSNLQWSGEKMPIASSLVVALHKVI